MCTWTIFYLSFCRHYFPIKETAAFIRTRKVPFQAKNVESAWNKTKWRETKGNGSIEKEGQVRNERREQKEKNVESSRQKRKKISLFVAHFDAMHMSHILLYGLIEWLYVSKTVRIWYGSEMWWYAPHRYRSTDIAYEWPHNSGVERIQCTYFIWLTLIFFCFSFVACTIRAIRNWEMVASDVAMLVLNVIRSVSVCMWHDSYCHRDHHRSCRCGALQRSRDISPPSPLLFSNVGVSTKSSL